MTGLPLVLGIGMTPFTGQRLDASLTDMVVDATVQALRDAGATTAHVDMGVASYESDHFNQSMSLGSVWNEAIGLTGKPLVRVEGGGATGALALQTARTAIMAGEARAVLVFGGETNGRSVNRATATEILALSADFDWETPLFGSFAAPYALMMTEHMRCYGTTPDQFAHVAVKNRREALANPMAHKGMTISVDDVLNSKVLATPYRLLDTSLLSDGAAAVLLATQEWALEHSTTYGQRPSVEYSGAGSATDHPRLADRDPRFLAHFSAKRAAARRAYEMAGITDPISQIDIAEVYDSFSGAEVQAYEDLGFCDIGSGGLAAVDGRFDREGRIPVNMSGGLLGRGSAVGATGIAQAIEIVGQLRGEVGAAREVRDARVGITDTHSGVGAICAVNVFRRAA